MMLTTRRPRPHLVILAIIAVIGLAVAVGAGLAIANDAGSLFHLSFLVAAGLTIAFTALAVLLARALRPAPRWFWRLAALLGITVCAGLASGTCAENVADTDATIAVGLGAAALALLITAAVIKIAADRGLVRFYALVGIAAYPVGWLTAFGGAVGAIDGLIFIVPAAAIAGIGAWRQYRIRPLTAVAIGCWAAIAAFLAALAFAWGFHANSDICPILYSPAPSASPPCQHHLNEVVFTLIAGGVPPALAAGAAWIAGGEGQRQARPPP